MIGYTMGEKNINGGYTMDLVLRISLYFTIVFTILVLLNTSSSKTLSSLKQIEEKTDSSQKTERQTPIQESQEVIELVGKLKAELRDDLERHLETIKGISESTIKSTQNDLQAIKEISET